MSRLPARRGGYLGSCFYSIYCGLSTVDLKFISRKSTSPQIGKKQVGSGSNQDIDGQEAEELIATDAPIQAI